MHLRRKFLAAGLLAFVSAGVSAQFWSVWQQTSAFGPPASQYVIEVTADAPTAWWRLGEAFGTAAADNTGNGYAGTYTGTFTLGAAALVAGDATTSLSINGAGDVDLGAPAGLQVDGFSIEANIYPTDLSTENAIFSYYITPSGAPFNGLVFYVGTDGKLKGYTASAGSGGSSSGDTVLVLNTSYHVAYTRTAGVAGGTKLYLNGIADGGGAGSSTQPEYSGAHAWIGALDGVVWKLKGQVQDVAIYDHELSAARILAHAQAAGH